MLRKSSLRNRLGLFHSSSAEEYLATSASYCNGSVWRLVAMQYDFGVVLHSVLGFDWLAVALKFCFLAVLHFVVYFEIVLDWLVVAMKFFFCAVLHVEMNLVMDAQMDLETDFGCLLVAMKFYFPAVLHFCWLLIAIQFYFDVVLAFVLVRPFVLVLLFVLELYCLVVAKHFYSVVVLHILMDVDSVLVELKFYIAKFLPEIYSRSDQSLDTCCLQSQLHFLFPVRWKANLINRTPVGKVQQTDFGRCHATLGGKLVDRRLLFGFPKLVLLLTRTLLDIFLRDRLYSALLVQGKMPGRLCIRQPTFENQNRAAEEKLRPRGHDTTIDIRSTCR
jgi:hypothetical protein